MGLPDDVRTVDLYPVRVKYDKKLRHGPEWDKYFPGKWDSIKKECHTFIEDLTRNDRFLMVMGEYTFPVVKELIGNRGWTMRPLPIDVCNIKSAKSKAKRVVGQFVGKDHHAVSMTSKSYFRGESQ